MADKKDPALQKAIREWGRKNGFLVSDGGPIPKAVVDNYNKHHKK